MPALWARACRGHGGSVAVAFAKTVSPSLRSAFEYIELPYLKVVERQELNELMQDQNAIRARWAARMRQKIDSGKTFSPAYLYPVHAWRLGQEMLVIGMGAETVVD